MGPCQFIFHQTIYILVLTTFCLSFLSYHLLFNPLKHFMPLQSVIKNKVDWYKYCIVKFLCLWPGFLLPYIAKILNISLDLLPIWHKLCTCVHVNSTICPRKLKLSVYNCVGACALVCIAIWTDFLFTDNYFLWHQKFSRALVFNLKRKIKNHIVGKVVLQKPCTWIHSFCWQQVLYIALGCPVSVN